MSEEKPEGFARLTIPLIASLGLGLAPFVPEPHLVGKIRWIAGGGVGMKGADYFDTLMHGAPWIWLIVTFVLVMKEKMTATSPS